MSHPTRMRQLRTWTKISLGSMLYLIILTITIISYYYSSHLTDKETKASEVNNLATALPHQDLSQSSTPAQRAAELLGIARYLSPERGCFLGSKE